MSDQSFELFGIDLKETMTKNDAPMFVRHTSRSFFHVTVSEHFPYTSLHTFYERVTFDNDDGEYEYTTFGGICALVCLFAGLLELASVPVWNWLTIGIATGLLADGFRYVLYRVKVVWATSRRIAEEEKEAEPDPKAEILLQLVSDRLVNKDSFYTVVVEGEPNGFVFFSLDENEPTRYITAALDEQCLRKFIDSYQFDKPLTVVSTSYSDLQEAIMRTKGSEMIVLFEDDQTVTVDRNCFKKG